MGSTSLAAALSLAAYISRICFRSPNPPPEQVHDQDTLMMTRGILPYFREQGFLLLAAAHVYATVRFRPQANILCPKPESLNAKYFTWSKYTQICLTIIYTAGALRILAFRTLGTNFTFELAPPDRLITTGIYRYMQHPSYLPDGLISLANLALFANPDGWMGSFLPMD